MADTPAPSLTPIDANGRARMVDVSHKAQTLREAADRLGLASLGQRARSSHLRAALYDGRYDVARERADSDGVRADMIGSGDRLYVYGNDGELSCFTVGSP